MNATPPAASPQPTVSQPIAPMPAPAPQVAAPPQPQAPPQPLPTTSSYPGVQVAQPQPQPVGYATPPAGYVVPPAYGGPPMYVQPQPQAPAQPQYAPQPQAQYIPQPQVAPQQVQQQAPQQVAPQQPPPFDAPTLAAPPEVRALLRPGESIMHFTHLQIGRRFWRPAERPIGETVRVYIMGAEWYLEDGVKSHFFQCKPLFQLACTLDNGSGALAGPGELVLVPITAEIAKLLKPLANANQHVPDTMLRHKGKGMLDVWILNSVVPRSVADQR
jgi:hypothetical protein